MLLQTRDNKQKLVFNVKLKEVLVKGNIKGNDIWAGSG